MSIAPSNKQPNLSQGSL